MHQVINLPHRLGRHGVSRKSGCCPTSPLRSSERARANHTERHGLSGQLTSLGSQTSQVSQCDSLAVVDGAGRQHQLPVVGHAVGSCQLPTSRRLLLEIDGPRGDSDCYLSVYTVANTHTKASASHERCGASQNLILQPDHASKHSSSPTVVGSMKGSLRATPAHAQRVRRSDIDVGKQLQCRSHAADDPRCIFTVGAEQLTKSFGVDRVAVVAVMKHVAMRFAGVRHCC